MTATNSPDGRAATHHPHPRDDRHHHDPPALLPGTGATDPEFLSAAEAGGRRQALEYARLLHARVPGYEHTQIASLVVAIGVWETSRLYGDYRLTRADVLNAAQFSDQIGLCGAPIEVPP